MLIEAEIYTMKNAPDQLTDDTEYAKRFSEWGDKTEMATLTRVSNTNFGRQLDPTDELHPSDYHRGRRAAYAAGFLPNRANGEWIKRGFDEAYEAGVRDRAGDPSTPVCDDELEATWFYFKSVKAKFAAGRCTAEEYDAARNDLMVMLGRIQTGARVMSAGEREREARMSG